MRTIAMIGLAVLGIVLIQKRMIAIPKLAQDIQNATVLRDARWTKYGIQ